MELPFRSAAVDAFVHATEDEQRVLAALQALLPEGVEVRRTRLKGHYGNPIVSLHASIGRRKLLHELWRCFSTKLRAGELDKLGKIASGRIDGTCRLHLRLDKQLAHAGEFALSDGGDVIHLKLKIDAYPAKQRVAAKLVEEFIAATRRGNF
ncbi:MAG: RNA-binding domain-containing protein [Candidatus Hodarchaeaceae archaeon]|nr:RNA-binding domain-containing protein [Candidatus Hodarchaeaceae archaeon]